MFVLAVKDLHPSGQLEAVDGSFGGICGQAGLAVSNWAMPLPVL